MMQVCVEVAAINTSSVLNLLQGFTAKVGSCLCVVYRI